MFANVLRPDDFLHVVPLLAVLVTACIALLASALGNGISQRLAPLTVFGIVGCLAVTVWWWCDYTQSISGIFGNMLVMDRYALTLDLIFLLAALLTALFADEFLRTHNVAEGDFYGLLLLIVFGMMLLVHSADFVSLVIGLETMSLGIYAMAAAWVEKKKSAEAGMKYFVMGSVASAFLLYGIALLYGVTGTTNFNLLQQRFGVAASDPLLIVGMFFVLGAMAFKVSLVPFHMWTPDAYEGAPTPITGFMASAVKAAGFGTLLRLVYGIFGLEFLTYGSAGWADLFWTLSALTMTVGNLAALRQTNLKRMLAYSSVSHAGYILLGVLAVGTLRTDPSAVLYYLMAYAATTLGAFGVIAYLGKVGAECTYVDDYQGLAQRRPAAALALTIFMLSLSGMPPTGGFFAKFYLLRTALDHPNLLNLVIIAVLNSVISVYYYLKPVVAMYFREGVAEAGTTTHQSGSAKIAIVVAVLAVLLLGVLPDGALAWVTTATLQ